MSKQEKKREHRSRNTAHSRKEAYLFQLIAEDEKRTNSTTTDTVMPMRQTFLIYIQ